MSGTRPATFTEPVAIDVVAVLRHDLVGPINLIVGYCDLLLAEAADSGQTTHLDSLRSIRRHGYALLSSIDEILLANRPGWSIAELQELATALEGPTTSLVADCDDLEAASRATSDPDDFIDDVRKIRAASVRMQVMAQALAVGRFPEADGPLAPAFT